MADQGTSSSNESHPEPVSAGPDLPSVHTVVIDDDGLVRVAGTIASSQANLLVARAVRDAVAAGARAVVLDLAEVRFAGVELVTLLADVPSEATGVRVAVLSPPRTMLLAVDALRMRHLLDLRDEPLH